MGRINETNDGVVIQPAVNTTKKDSKVEIALDAVALNQAIVKDEHQMPILDNLLDMVASPNCKLA